MNKDLTVRADTACTPEIDLSEPLRQSFPSYINRHVLQLYLIRHRRPPECETEYHKAVIEYLLRGKADGSEKAPILATTALTAWLAADDPTLRSWGNLPRLAGLLYRHVGDLRKKYDLLNEQDYYRFSEYLSLTLQPRFGWPDEFIGDSLRNVLWQVAPGVPQIADWKVTRGLLYLRRFSPALRNSDLSDRRQVSNLMFAVLNHIGNRQLPGYALSPIQYEYLTRYVDRMPIPRGKVTGLIYESSVGRGLIKEKDLARNEVLQVIIKTFVQHLPGMTLPGSVRTAHESLFRLSPSVLPTDGEAAVKEHRVTVIGPISHGSGLGAAARACVDACRSGNLEVDVYNRADANWGRNDEAATGEAPTEVRGDINLIHFNPDVLVEHMARIGFNLFKGRYNIGYFVWETSKATLAHRLGIDLVDEIWVPTHYCAELFRQCTDKPITIVGTPIPKIGSVSWANRDYFGLPKDKYIFIFTFDGASRFTRKNPMAAVDAFKQAFPDDQGVVLLLKTQNTAVLSKLDNRFYADIRKQAKQDARIRIVDESFTSNEVHGLISVCDCYVSLHRSEGFGYGMAEAMSLGLPVIATAYSGNADFVTEKTAYPVRYSLCPVDKDAFVYDEPGQEWAEPDVAHAADLMQRVRSDPEREEKIGRARSLMENEYSEAAVGRIYKKRIDEIRRFP